MDHQELVTCLEKRIKDWDDTETRLAKDKAHEEFLRDYVRPGRFDDKALARGMKVGELENEVLPAHDVWPHGVAICPGSGWLCRCTQKEFYNVDLRVSYDQESNLRWMVHAHDGEGGRQYVSVKDVGIRVLTHLPTIMDELEERPSVLAELHDIDGVTNEAGVLLLSHAEATLAADPDDLRSFKVASDLVKALDLVESQEHHDAEEVDWPWDEQAAARNQLEDLKAAYHPALFPSAEALSLAASRLIEAWHRLPAWFEKDADIDTYLLIAQLQLYSADGDRLRRNNITAKGLSWIRDPEHIRKADYEYVRQRFPSHNILSRQDLDTSIYASLIARAALYGEHCCEQIDGQLSGQFTIDRYLGPVDGGTKDEETYRLWVSKFFPSDGPVARSVVNGARDSTSYANPRTGGNEALRKALNNFHYVIHEQAGWRLPRMVFDGLIRPHARRGTTDDVAAIWEYTEWVDNALNVGMEEEGDKTAYEMPPLPRFTDEERAEERLQQGEEWRYGLQVSKLAAQLAAEDGEDCAIVLEEDDDDEWHPERARSLDQSEILARFERRKL